MWMYGWKGAVITLTYFHLLHVVDAFTSNGLSRSLEVCRASGFSAVGVWLRYAINSAWWWNGNFLLTQLYRDEIIPYFSLRLVAQQLVVLSVSEVLFFAAHQFLHRHLPSQHVFHHCFRYSTYTASTFSDMMELVWGLKALQI
jgi:hypothetical protein